MAEENINKRTLPRWLLIFIVINAIQIFVIGFLATFNLEALAGHVPSADAQHHASFMAGRQFVIAFALIGLLVIKEYRSLAYFLVAVGFIQIYDASLNIINGEIAGELMAMVTLAVLNLLSARYVLKMTAKS